MTGPENGGLAGPLRPPCAIDPTDADAFETTFETWREADRHCGGLSRGPYRGSPAHIAAGYATIDRARALGAAIELRLRQGRDLPSCLTPARIRDFRRLAAASSSALAAYRARSWGDGSHPSIRGALRAAARFEATERWNAPYPLIDHLQDVVRFDTCIGWRRSDRRPELEADETETIAVHGGARILVVSTRLVEWLDRLADHRVPEAVVLGPSAPGTWAGSEGLGAWHVGICERRTVVFYRGPRAYGFERIIAHHGWPVTQTGSV